MVHASCIYSWLHAILSTGTRYLLKKTLKLIFPFGFRGHLYWPNFPNLLDRVPAITCTPFYPPVESRLTCRNSSTTRRKSLHTAKNF